MILINNSDDDIKNNDNNINNMDNNINNTAITTGMYFYDYNKR
jgi:hypothetical protein